MNMIMIIFMRSRVRVLFMMMIGCKAVLGIHIEQLIWYDCSAAATSLHVPQSLALPGQSQNSAAQFIAAVL
jgi:hypothetical protein